VKESRREKSREEVETTGDKEKKKRGK